MPSVKEACCRRSGAVLRVMACKNVWPVLLVCAAALVFWYPVLGFRHHTVHPNEGRKAFAAVSPKRASLEVEVDFLAPSAAVGRGPRQPCNGFAQLETLKGKWVDQQPGYMGINPNTTCPSFVEDFSCLNRDYIDPKYRGRIEKVYRQAYKPYVCELRPFSAEQFEACLPGKRIIIIGDSTMRQLYQSLACLLSPVIITGHLTDWKDASQALTSIAFNRSYPIRDEPGASILKQNIGSFTLRNRASVHIRSFGIFNLQLWDDVMAEFAPITQDDILIVEFGAWYPRFNSYHMHTPWIRYQLDMAELFGQRLKMYPGLVLWRSYAPTHFGGPTGTYTALNEHMPHLPAQEDCEPASHGEYFYDTWVHKYLTECGDECSNIHMLPVYHLSLPAYDSHHGSVGRGIDTKHIDCRHYCSNVIDVWGQVLFNKLCFAGTAASH